MIVRILAGLLLVLLAVVVWQRGSLANAKRDADQATARADAAEARAESLTQAIARDAVADALTAAAEQGMDANAAAINARMTALEGRLHDRPPVPTVCPSPDPVLVRDAAEAAGRVRSAEDRLRRLRTPEG